MAKNINPKEIQDSFSRLADKVNEVNTAFPELSKNIKRHASDMHRLYHEEFSGRLLKMEAELEEYRKKDKSMVDDGDQILIELAVLYSENVGMLVMDSTEKLSKRVDYLFHAIKAILERYGVEMLKSSKGDPRNTRHCKVIQRIATDNKEEHDTICESLSVGFFVGNKTLVKENVDVYIYREEATVGVTESDSKYEVEIKTVDANEISEVPEEQKEADVSADFASEKTDSTQ